MSRWRRQLRGVLLLLSLLWVPTSVVLAVLHILLWVSVPLAVLTVVAVLVWLRLEVRADRARAERLRAEAARPSSRTGDPDGDDNRASTGRRPGRPRGGRSLTSDDTQVILAGQAPAEAAAPSAEFVTATSAAVAPAPSASATAAVAPAPSASATAGAPAPADRPVRREAGSAAYDFEADLAREAAPAPAAQPAEEGTWSPVPVPRPTYTMKAKAEPRLTAAGIPADVFATPEFAEEAEELDERGLFARRAANL